MNKRLQYPITPKEEEVHVAENLQYSFGLLLVSLLGEINESRATEERRERRNPPRMLLTPTNPLNGLLSSILPQKFFAPSLAVKHSYPISSPA